MNSQEVKPSPVNQKETLKKKKPGQETTPQKKGKEKNSAQGLRTFGWPIDRPVGGKEKKKNKIKYLVTQVINRESRVHLMHSIPNSYRSKQGRW